MTDLVGMDATMVKMNNEYDERSTSDAADCLATIARNGSCIADTSLNH